MNLVTARFRRVRDSADSGAALIFVLLVTLLVTLLATTVSAAVTSQTRPAKASEDQAVANAAAETGLDDFAARANANCRTPGACSWITPALAQTATYVSGSSGPTFSWRLLNASSYVADRYLRVVSTGRSPAPGQQVKTLVADFTTSYPCPLCDNEFYTQFETLGSSLINSRFPARTIKIDNATSASAIGQSGSNLTASWVAPTMPASGSSTIPAGSPAVCDRYWYDDATIGGGRNQYAKGPFNSDWNQAGSVGATPYTNYGKCEVTYGHGAHFDGPVFSMDAMLLSNTTPGSTGPFFGSTAHTFWGGIPATSTPNAAPPWRTQDSPIGYTKPAGGSNPVSWPVGLTFPSTITGLPTTNICTYSGPTRVLMTGDGYATITSPLTQANPASVCTNNQSGSVSDGGTGVVSARVPLNGYTIVANNSAASPTNSYVFNEVNTSPVGSVVAKPNTHTTAAWGATADDVAFKNRVNTALTTDPTLSLSAAMAQVISAAYPSTSVAGTGGAYSWVLDTHSAGTVASSGPTGSTQTITVAGPSSDPLLDQHSGSATYTENKTVTNFTDSVHEVRYACWTLGLVLASTNTASCPLLSSPSWQSVGDSQSPTSTRTTYTYTTTDTIAADANASTFPIRGDVTPYSQTKGDIYVEGALSGRASLVAYDDIVVTGAVSYANPASDGLGLIALNNARIYHPVKCLDTNAASVAATTAGFCPNDITGLYPITGVPTWSVHPSQQYVNMRSDLNGLSVSAAIFALTGSVYTDNYDRGGETLGSLQLRGSSFQAHRGALGEKWEIQTTGVSRHSTGYDVSYSWDSTLGQGSRILPYVPTGVGATSGRTWSLQSISTSNTLTAS